MSDKKIQNSNFSQLLPFLKPYKVQIVGAFIALLITAVMILLFGKIIKYLIDYGFAGGNKTFIIVSLIGFVLATIVMSVAGYYRSSLINSVAEKVIAKLRKKTYEHIITISPEFFELNKAGDIISRLTSDTTLLYSIISNTASFLLRNSIFFIGGLLLLFFTSTKLSLISLLLIPIAIAPIIILGKKVKKLSLLSQEKLANVSSRIEESVNGIKTIQSHNCENKEVENFSREVDDFLEISLKKIRIKSLMVALVITFAFSTVALILLIGGLDVLNKKITSGDLSSFIFYSIIIATSLVSIGQIAGQLQTASAALNRVLDLLQIQSPITQIKNPKKLTKDKEISIKFSNCNFAYQPKKDDNKTFCLSNFNLEIKPNEKIAIVGPSGSGKSTIFQLLLRFYDCQEGEILLNNENIRNLSLKDLRNSFSYISQDCFIFSDTIFNNIAYFDKNISKKQAQKTIDDTEALDFINKLPSGLENFVGQKGVRLSGGERQRIAIARAILKDAPILLLDEATSALDNENEKLIANTITKIAKNKTVITIAHKLSTIINADKIVYIQDGKILEVGSHAQLIKQNAFYKKMYDVEVKKDC
ncbi:MAG: ATP-binding cassette domain-containing protein [Rickettsiales bacterium]|nr:ATP-binding cassette domain-containing protein [Rickettsiales bacterium]